METIGDRLKRERVRLGMTQREMASLGGVQENAQIYYEKDRRQLPAAYLVAVAGHGVNVSYVLCGTRPRLLRGAAAEEAALIQNLRVLEVQQQKDFIRLITTLTFLTLKAG